MNDYFSAREFDSRGLNEHTISPPVRAANVAALQNLLNSGAFDYQLLERCRDEAPVSECDESAVGESVTGEMWPNKAWTTAKHQEIWSCNRMQTEREVLAFAGQTRRISRSCAPVGPELRARKCMKEGGAA